VRLIIDIHEEVYKTTLSDNGSLIFPSFFVKAIVNSTSFDSVIKNIKADIDRCSSDKLWKDDIFEIIDKHTADVRGEKSMYGIIGEEAKNDI